MGKGIAIIGALLAVLPAAVSTASTSSQEARLFWMKVHAENKFERTRIASQGAVIEHVADNYVIATGSKKVVKALDGVIQAYPLSHQQLDFPREDSKYHTYQEMKEKLKQLEKTHSDIMDLDTIGSSHKGRSLFHARISTDLEQSHQKPGIVFMGGHHAREHLSVEVPLHLIEHLLEEYKKSTPRIVELLQSREIHILPLINPDGAEYDISGNEYHYWRKNRRPVGPEKSYTGTDLNRNYGYKFGGRGASDQPQSDIYHGPHAFSEPETEAVKRFIENNVNISILVSFHTYSELILYPWGHKFDPIANKRDRRVHQIMAKKMAQWNDYTPQQTSELYAATGDTTDWAYGRHKIISFTFELDPESRFDGGFYPGDDIIKPVFQKNLKPCLYLAQYADNPYRVLPDAQESYGFNSPLLSL